MKCKKCGASFGDGIFCPECGTRQTENTVDKVVQEAELLKQKNLEKDLESKTVNGVLYKTYEDAVLAREEHMKLNIFKSKLLTTRSQKKRQEILDGYTESFITPEVRNRYEMLKMKVETPAPISEKICNIYGITVLVSIIAFNVIVLMVGDTDNVLGTFMFFWACLGVLAWPIWKIVQLIKWTDKNHYKNIKNI